MYFRMLQGEHSAILSTFIKLPFVIKIFVLSIFEWPFYTCFTVLLFSPFPIIDKNIYFGAYIGNNISPDRTAPSDQGSMIKLSLNGIWIQWKLFILTLFITKQFFTTLVVFAQTYQFILNLISSQQKFSLTSNYLGTNTVIVKRFGCICSGRKKQTFSWQKIITHRKRVEKF